MTKQIMKPLIDPTRLDTIFRDCLFRDGEPHGDHVVCEGVVNNFGLHPERLESHRDEVKTMLAQFANDFYQQHGGGMSFLNMCYDRKENHWGEHVNIEQLIAMGFGLGHVKFCLPREYWSSLPGGVPYVMICNIEPAND